MRIIISGAIGFISSHLVNALQAAGHEVWGVDAILPQVHADKDGSCWKAREKAQQTFEYGSFYEGLASDGVAGFLATGKTFDAILLMGARVGVGQSQYERAEYTRLNCLDTDKVLDTLASHGWKGRLIAASSMSVYGEGPLDWGKAGPDYRDAYGNLMADLKMCVPRGAREDDPLPLIPANHYALTKRCQEASVLCFGEAYEGVTATALRFFNIYGEGQALSNPYTGVAAMFAARLLQGLGGLIYEDGLQSRDFIHVSDVVRAIMLALDAPESEVSGQVFNVCTGVQTTLLTLHETLALCLGGDDFWFSEGAKKREPTITGVKRKGDIRHCFGDPRKAEEAIGFKAEMPLVDGILRYSRWLKTVDVSAIQSRVEEELLNLRRKGLVE